MASRLKSRSLGEVGEASNGLRGERGATIGKITACVLNCVCLCVQPAAASHAPCYNFISFPPGWKNSVYLYGSGATQ